MLKIPRVFSLLYWTVTNTDFRKRSSYRKQTLSNRNLTVITWLCWSEGTIEVFFWYWHGLCHLKQSCYGDLQNISVCSHNNEINRWGLGYSNDSESKSSPDNLATVPCLLFPVPCSVMWFFFLGRCKEMPTYPQTERPLTDARKDFHPSSAWWINEFITNSALSIVQKQFLY